MDVLINDLVERFERGRLSRRELIGGLSMLVAGARAAATERNEAAGITAAGIDHVSILASDPQRSAAFYRNLFGLSLLSEDKRHGILRLGRDRVIVSLRREKPYGTVDHFGVRVESFDRATVTRALRARGLTPQENWQYGYYVKDPDGVNVQLL